MNMRAERNILIVILSGFLLAAVGIFLSVHNYHPIPRDPGDPGTGIPGEKLQYRNEAIAFARENEEFLHRVMQETLSLPGNVQFLDMDCYVGMETYEEPVLRVNFERVVQNTFLESALQDTLLENIDIDNDYWSFGLDFSSGIVTSSLYYDIIYCEKDPAPYIHPFFGDHWTAYGNGRLRHDETDYVDFYLEEIGDGFWYSFIGWP